MHDILNRLGKFTIIGFFTYGSSLAFSGTMGSQAESNWYLGLEGSVLWASLPAELKVNNGAPYPYNNDAYELNSPSGGSAALNLGYEWQRASYWIPTYALGLQYEHFFLEALKGNISQYSLPQFTNYHYSWNNSVDLLAIYTKITLCKHQGLRPFVNGGLGWAMNHSSRVNEQAYPNVTPRISPGFGQHTQNALAYNVGAGLDYELSPQWSASIAYNYQNLGTVHSGMGQSSWAGEDLKINNYQANMLRFGLTYHLA